MLVDPYISIHYKIILQPRYNFVRVINLPYIPSHVCRDWHFFIKIIFTLMSSDSSSKWPYCDIVPSQILILTTWTISTWPKILSLVTVLLGKPDLRKTYKNSDTHLNKLYIYMNKCGSHYSTTKIIITTSRQNFKTSYQKHTIYFTWIIIAAVVVAVVVWLINKDDFCFYM